MKKKIFLNILIILTLINCSSKHNFNQKEEKQKKMLKDSLMNLLINYNFDEENNFVNENKRFSDEMDISPEPKNKNDFNYSGEKKLLQLLIRIENSKLLTKNDLKPFGIFFIEKKYLWMLASHKGKHSVITDNISYWCDDNLCWAFVNLIEDKNGDEKFVLNKNYPGDIVCINDLLNNKIINNIGFKEISSLHRKTWKKITGDSIQCTHIIKK